MNEYAPEELEETAEDKPGGKTYREWQQYWGKQMSAANKRLERFLKQGEQVYCQYLDDRDMAGLVGEDRPFKINLFHTNIQTQEAMLYGQTPKVDVSREHADPDDDIARVAAQIMQRMLQADVDPSLGGTHAVLGEVLQDRLLPGLGVARVRYEYDAEEQPQIDPETLEINMVEVVTDERVPADYVHWSDFRWGWTRTYADMPWMAFRAYMDKDEVEKRFGEEIAKELEYKKQSESASDDRGADEDKKSVGEKAEIWEIWCKKTRKVFFFNSGCATLLDCVDDPLQLDNFWPIPRPMAANLTTRQWIPKADYVVTQDLYNEINELATRISLITDAIKVVGVYDKSAGGSVGRMLKEGTENSLIPVDNWAMFAEKGGLKGSIDWFPVEVIVGVLQTLREVLADTKAQLYEVTGMSDLLRGAQTQQYTGASTEQMRAQMGSIRMQKMQDDFARFASDLEALRGEVISKHFQDESIAKQGNVQFLPDPDKQLVLPAIQLLKSPDCKWRIDIRPESVAMVDYAQVKGERTEFLNAMATYIQSAQAMVQQVPGSLPILMQALKWAMASFKGAGQLEGLMDQAIDQAVQAQQSAQQNQQPSPEVLRLETEKLKAQAAQMKMQGDIQKIRTKAQADMALAQQKMNSEIQKIVTDAQRDSTLEEQQYQNRMAEMAQEFQNTMEEIMANLDSAIAIENTQANADMVSNEQQHRFTLREMAAQARLRGG